MVLINIQHKYNEQGMLKKNRTRADLFLDEDTFIEATYGEASTFVNYLLQNDDTESSLKEKIFSRKELQQYLTTKNLESFKPNPSNSFIHLFTNRMPPSIEICRDVNPNRVSLYLGDSSRW